MGKLRDNVTQAIFNSMGSRKYDRFMYGFVLQNVNMLSARCKVIEDILVENGITTKQELHDRLMYIYNNDNLGELVKSGEKISDEALNTILKEELSKWLRKQ